MHAFKVLKKIFVVVRIQTSKLRDPRRYIIKCRNLLDNVRFLNLGWNYWGSRIAQETLIDLSQVTLNRTEANAYEAGAASDFKLLERWLAKSPRFVKHQEVFIDLGSGKGKFVYLASKSRMYKEIIGLEFDPYLVSESRKLLLNIGLPDHFEIRQQDIRETVLPNKNTTIFLFNSCGEGILKEFVDKNEEHFRRHDSLIFYVNAKHVSVFSNFDNVIRLKKTLAGHEIYVIYNNRSLSFN